MSAIPNEIDFIHERQAATSQLITGLDFIWLELTNQCNLQCIHCYSNSGPNERDRSGLGTVDWLRILGEARALGCQNVQFIGGEPLLYPHLLDLIREARRLNYDVVEVFSNGTRLTEDLARFFSEFGVMLATSFYSDDPCIHDAITGVPRSQQRTVQGLRRAIAHGIRTRVGVIAMPENEVTLSSTLEFLKTIGVDRISHDHVRGIGRGRHIAPNTDPQLELCGGCWRGSLAINPKGDVSPCIFSHFRKIGNVSEGLENIIKNPALHRFREATRDMDRNRHQISGAPSNSDCIPYFCDPKYWCNPKYCGPNS